MQFLLLKIRICDKVENTHPGDGLRVRLLYGGGHVPGEDAVEPQPPVLAEGHQLAVGGEGDGARLAAVQLGRVVAGHQHRGVLLAHCCYYCPNLTLHHLALGVLDRGVEDLPGAVFRHSGHLAGVGGEGETVDPTGVTWYVSMQ